jgi:hypothetical protein
MQPSFTPAHWPVGQPDVRRAGFRGCFGGFKVRLYLILGGLREPNPFSFRFALRPLAAIGFQFLQPGKFFHRRNARPKPHEQFATSGDELPGSLSLSTIQRRVMMNTDNFNRNLSPAATSAVKIFIE